MRIDKALIKALEIIRDNSVYGTPANYAGTFGIDNGKYNQLLIQMGVKPSDEIIKYLFDNKLIVQYLSHNQSSTGLPIVSLSPDGVLFLIQVENANATKNSLIVAVIALLVSFFTLLFAILFQSF